MPLYQSHNPTRTTNCTLFLLTQNLHHNVMISALKTTTKVLVSSLNFQLNHCSSNNVWPNILLYFAPLRFLRIKSIYGDTRGGYDI